MKNNSLRLLSLFAVLTLGASAASQKSDVTDLPTYVVAGSRHNDAEQAVQDSLQALRQQAASPVLVSLDLPAFKDQGASELSQTRQANKHRALRLAKS